MEQEVSDQAGIGRLEQSMQAAKKPAIDMSVVKYPQLTLNYEEITNCTTVVYEWQNSIDPLFKYTALALEPVKEFLGGILTAFDNMQNLHFCCDRFSILVKSPIRMGVIEMPRPLP